MPKFSICLFLGALFLLLLSPGVFALGLAPSKLGYINFVPNLTVEEELYVFNTEPYDFPVEMELGGDLGKYANLSEYYFVLGPKDSDNFAEALTLKVTLPERLDEPGEHIIKVGALQASVGHAPGMLSARVKVATALFVFVPFPGKYIETDFSIDNAKVNETIAFKITVTHRGNLTIESIQGNIELYDSIGRRIGYLQTNGMKLEPGESGELKAEWEAFNVKPGNYQAIAVVDYDGIKKEIKKDFRIGSPVVNIINVTSAPIVNGTVGKIVAKVTSFWDEKIPNVYIKVSINRDAYSKDLTSQSITLGPWSDADLEIYWDTADAAGPGDYPANVTVFYMDKNDSVSITLTVKEKPFDSSLLIIGAIIILVIFAAVFYTKKKGHKTVQKRLA